MRLLRNLSSTAIALAIALPAAAATVVPPRDLGELARAADLVVLARAESSTFASGTLTPVTLTRFRPIERISGAAADTPFTVREVGGVVGDRGFAAPGVPQYRMGETYLLFLGHRYDGNYQSLVLAYGVLRLDATHGILEPIPEAEDLSLIRAEGAVRPTRYRAAALLAHLHEVVLGLPFRQDLVAVSDPAPAAINLGPAECRQVTYSGDGLPVRWFGFESGSNFASIWATTPGQSELADGGQSAVSGGVGAWASFTDGALDFRYNGVHTSNITCTGGTDLSQGNVIFNDPCSDIQDMSGCSGILAFGGTYFSTATQSYDGTPWHSASSPFVVVNNGAGCIGTTNFAEMMTHELGHTMGFGHHTDPAATMYAMCCHSPRGAALAATDRMCASFQYHTFLDVPYDFWAWHYVEAIQNAGVTAGCGTATYCPGNAVSREQMAVFLLKAKLGGAYNPPACVTPPFADVPCSSQYAKWIADLAARGITAGCGGGNFCPSGAVTREQMAAFLLKTKEGSGYLPPACTVPTFSDVPCSSNFAPWVEELVDRGITAGCGGGNYCPAGSAARDQMSVFLTKTFSLAQPTP